MKCFCDATMFTLMTQTNTNTNTNKTHLLSHLEQSHLVYHVEL